MRARSVTFLVTISVWTVLCGLVLAGLIRSAHNAAPGTIEEYARRGSFQVINFAIGYLPGLLVILAVVLGAEWLIFRGIRLVSSRGEQ